MTQTKKKKYIDTSTISSYLEEIDYHLCSSNGSLFTTESGTMYIWELTEKNVATKSYHSIFRHTNIIFCLAMYSIPF